MDTQTKQFIKEVCQRAKIFKGYEVGPFRKYIYETLGRALFGGLHDRCVRCMTAANISSSAEEEGAEAGPFTALDSLNVVGGREEDGEVGTEIRGVARLDLLRRRRSFEDLNREDQERARDLLGQMGNASVVMDARDDMAEYVVDGTADPGVVEVEEGGMGFGESYDGQWDIHRDAASVDRNDDGELVPSQSSSIRRAAAEDLEEGDTQNNNILEDQHNSDRQGSRPVEALFGLPPDSTQAGESSHPPPAREERSEGLNGIPRADDSLTNGAVLGRPPDGS